MVGVLINLSAIGFKIDFGGTTYTPHYSMTLALGKFNLYNYHEPQYPSMINSIAVENVMIKP